MHRRTQISRSLPKAANVMTRLVMHNRIVEPNSRHKSHIPRVIRLLLYLTWAALQPVAMLECTAQHFPSRQKPVVRYGTCYSTSYTQENDEGLDSENDFSQVYLAVHDLHLLQFLSV